MCDWPVSQTRLLAAPAENFSWDQQRPGFANADSKYCVLSRSLRRRTVSCRYSLPLFAAGGEQQQATKADLDAVDRCVCITLLHRALAVRLDKSFSDWRVAFAHYGTSPRRSFRCLNTGTCCAARGKPRKMSWCKGQKSHTVRRQIYIDLEREARPPDKCPL